MMNLTTEKAMFGGEQRGVFFTFFFFQNELCLKKLPRLQ